jgi:hypothetical protein
VDVVLTALELADVAPPAPPLEELVALEAPEVPDVLEAVEVPEVPEAPEAPEVPEVVAVDVELPTLAPLDEALPPPVDDIRLSPAPPEHAGESAIRPAPNTSCKAMRFFMTVVPAYAPGYACRTFAVDLLDCLAKAGY